MEGGSGNKPICNATVAAQEAGYSKKTAYSQGSRLLKKVEIKNRIDELLDVNMKRYIINAERVLAELSILGTVDTTKAFDANGNLLPIHDIPEDVRRAIAGFEVVEEIGNDGEPTGTFTKKVKFWDKNTSLLGLAKVFKMLNDKLDVKVNVTMENFLGGTWPDDDKDKKK